MKIIIVGAGEIGFHVAKRLEGENQEVTIIETSEKRLRELAEVIDAGFLLGNGASPEVLKKAGVLKAEMLVAVTDRDEINVVSCLMAEILNPGIITIGRVRDPDFHTNRDLFYQQPLELDLFINPEVEAAERIMRILRMPLAEDILEFAGGLVQLLAFHIDEGNRLAGKRLIDIAREGQRLLLAGIRRKGKWIIPHGEDKILPGDVAYVSSPMNNVQNIVNVLGKTWTPIKTVMIYGGGNVGYYLARRLEMRDIKVKIIDPNPDVCEFLAENLKHAIVLNGFGMDETLLKEENIGGIDAFVALTSDEEENIISSLLAKNLGARMAITLTNKLSYGNLIHAIGLDAVVSPQVEAVGAIMRYIRRGKVARVQALREGEAEALEFEALATADIVGKPLKEIQFPQGAILMAVVRGDEIIIPTGNTVVQVGDRVLTFCLQEAMNRMESLFSVKLQFLA